MNSNVLIRFNKTVDVVEFDATKPDHLEAYTYLTKYGRQHPFYRFMVEHPYTDVLSMMAAKIAAVHISRLYPNVLETTAKHAAYKATS